VFLPATALTVKAISAVESGLEVIGNFFILAAPLGWIDEGALLHHKGKKVLRIYRSCLAVRATQQTMRFLKSIPAQKFDRRLYA
jgi:hypothetical protein